MNAVIDQAVQKEFKIGGTTLQLWIDPTTSFSPNQTTDTVYSAVNINPQDRGIEIGAGIGPGSVYVGLNPSLSKLYAVEVVPAQCELLRRNLASYGIESKVEVLQGSLFEPLRTISIPEGVNFIVSDVSGMDERRGRLLGWYPSCIPLGGEDGTANIIPFLEGAVQFLNKSDPQARVYFPVVVQFSNGAKILQRARDVYAHVEKVNEKDLPLMGHHLQALEGYTPHTPYKTRGTRNLWTVEVYQASTPRQ